MLNVIPDLAYSVARVSIAPEMIVDHLEHSAASFRAALWAGDGGVSAEATALAHRSRPVMVNVNAAYERPGSGSLPRWRRVCPRGGQTIAEYSASSARNRGRSGSSPPRQQRRQLGFA